MSADRRGGPPARCRDRPAAARPARRLCSVTALLGLAAALGACGGDDAQGPDASDDLVLRYGLEPMPAMVHPADNPPDPDRIALGKLIFFDPVQSSGGDVACATCHLPRFGFADGRDLPLGPSGIGLGPQRRLTDPDMVPEARHSPTVVNVGFNRFGAQVTADGFMFWDGRVRRLERLVTLPQLEFSEMRGDAVPVEAALDSVLARIRRIPEYVELFRAAFPERAALADAGALESVVDSTTLSQALAQFVRSLTGVESAYDRYVAGDRDALSDAARRGLILFHEKAGCVRCHSGPMFSDFQFHVVGARQLGPGFQTTPHDDPGRWLVTRVESDRYRFRTPSLRNVAETAPYMHSGGYATLRDVVEFFNRGGGDHPFVDPARLEIEPLGLTDQEIDDLVTFLGTLSDMPEIEIPERVPSGLAVPR
ncbi:MAG: cytochrome-c peroxidase [Gemmatimonadetes bacterium]|nr:MAG: cytochrome-c peroxidase [Gemmatimonadota bacterium]